MIDAGACLVAALTGEVSADGPGWEERLHVTVFHRDGCAGVDFVLPPGVSLVDPVATVTPADGARYRLGPERWARVAVRADGTRTVRALLDDLGPGDRVDLRLERRWDDPVDYTWAPGLDGAAFAELRPPRGHTHVHAGLSHAGDVVWARPPGPDAWLTVSHAWAPRAPATVPPTHTQGLPVADAAERLRGLALVPRLVDGRNPVVGDAALDRGALDDRGWARTLLALCHGGPDTLALGRWAPSDHAPPAPGALEVVVARTPEGSQVWRHPDLPLPAGTLVTPWGRLPVAAEAGRPDAPLTAPTPLQGPPPDALEAVLTLTLPGRAPGASLGRRPEATVHVAWTARWHATDAPRALAVPVPPGATPDPGLTHGHDALIALAPTGAAEARFAWTAPLHDAWGQLPWAPTAPAAALVTGDGTTALPAEVVWDDARTWRLAALSGRPVLASRDVLLDELGARLQAVAYPEPATSRRERGDTRGWELSALLTDLLGGRVVVRPLPAAPPLFPRPLTLARRQRVITPLEAAAILALTHRQGHLQADWVLVKPRAAGPWAGVAPAGLDAALVRVEHAGEERWIDPACDACGPWELPPELLASDAIGPGSPASTPTPRLDPPERDGLWTLPTSPPHTGRTDVQIDAAATRWTFTGLDALTLRRWLMAQPADGRADALRALLGAAPGAPLQADGTGGRGAPITLTFDGPPADPDPLGRWLTSGVPAATLPGLRTVVRPTTPTDVEVTWDEGDASARVRVRDGITTVQVLVRAPVASPPPSPAGEQQPYDDGQQPEAHPEEHPAPGAGVLPPGQPGDDR